MGMWLCKELAHFIALEAIALGVRLPSSLPFLTAAWKAKASKTF